MSAGRQRGFDREQALDRAAKLFWRDGYQGMSVDEFLEATGTSRASFLAAYGDKERLFRAAVVHYVAGPGSYVRRALERPQAAEAIGALLLDAAAAFASTEHPPGCLVVHGALASGEEDALARDLLLSQRLTWQTEIRARLERGVADGEMPVGTNVVMMAEYVMTVLNGMAVQALAGADRAALTAVAELALRAMDVSEPAAATPRKRGRGPARGSVKQAKSDGLAGQLAMDL